MSDIIPLSAWYPAMYVKWLARLAELQRQGVRTVYPLSERVGWVIHHTVGGRGVNPTAYARQVADQHWEQWRRPGGYNFLGGEDGQVREMSGYLHIGAHSGTTEWNRKTLGYAFQGDFRTREPTKAMLATGAQFISQTPIPDTQWTHRQVRPTPTTCPGAALIRLLPLETNMQPPTQKQILDALNLPPSAISRLRQIDASATKAGFAVSVQGVFDRLFKYGKADEFPGGGGTTEARVKQLIEGSRIKTGD